MSKTSLVVAVVVLAALLVTSNMMLLAGLKAQDRALSNIESVAKMQDGWIYFTQYDMSRTNKNERRSK